MKRVLLVSTDVVGSAMAGPGIRAWELARALAGEAIITLAAPNRADVPALPNLRVTRYELGRPGALAPLLAEADLAIGQGFVFAEQPELLESPLPLAIDLYDPLLLEALDLYGDTSAETAEHHRRYLALTDALLRRGDFFFCATERQRDYWLGALSVAGRVNAQSFAHDRTLRALIDCVPSGIPSNPPAAARPALRGVNRAIGEADVLLLWAGGLWDWFDPLTPIRAVAALGAELPALRLCFFAGARPNAQGQPFRTRTHAAARALAAELGVLDRSVIFLEDWVPYDARGAYLAEADVGVSAHLPGIETRFAFRTRLLDYLWARLPVVCTAGDSLGEEMGARGAGLLVGAEDLDGWVVALRRMHDDAALRAACRSGAEAIARDYTWARVAEPLAAFCRAGRIASDRVAAVDRQVMTLEGDGADLHMQIGELTQQIERKNRHIRDLEALIGRLENGRIMRMLRLMKRN